VSSASQWPGERIAKAVRPDAQQEAKLNALKTAMGAAADELTKACSLQHAGDATGASDGNLNATRHHAGVRQERRGALADYYSSA
jgi:hypothetical protein